MKQRKIINIFTIYKNSNILIFFIQLKIWEISNKLIQNFKK